jgi:hydroxymethylbilane synthase
MRIGTRGSALALAQARQVVDRPEIVELGGAELITITTSGDRGAPEEGVDKAEGVDKSRWVDAIEAALLAGEIDLAVHSAKDLPGELAEGLALLGAPARAPAEDVLCVAPGSGGGVGKDASSPGPDESVGEGVASLGPGGGVGEDSPSLGPEGRVVVDCSLLGLEALELGARVGTSSVRRAAQLRAAREDLEIVMIHGNVDTRLRKLRKGSLDAIVLARAGLLRLGRESELGAILDPGRFVPAPGQGVLGLEGRVDDERAAQVAQAITDAEAFACLAAERAVARTLGASCHTPLGAHAVPAGCGCLQLRAWVGLPDGSAWLSDELLGGFYDPEALGRRVAERLQAAGAEDLLRRAQELAATPGGAGR